MPAASITETERPVGIAPITCIGLVGSFVAPIVTGWLKDASGSYAGGMYLAAAGIVLGALTALLAARTLSQRAVGLPHQPENT